MHALDRTSLVLLAAVIASAGCTSVAPAPPPHWTSRALEISESSHAQHARLQVIVTYDPTYSTHTALRLETAGDGVLFWDPAGRYAQTDSGRYDHHVKRVNDLIVGNPPTLEAYWLSSVNASDIAMEVFEWDLAEQQTRRMRQALVQGAGLEASANDFRTETMKPFCSLAVSEFLSQFADDPVRLDGSYFLPHSLAEALYGKNPDRVMVFRRGRETTVYTKPARQ